MERVDEGGSGMKQSLLGCRMLTGMDAGWDAGCLLGWDAGPEKGQDTWSCFPRFLTIPGNILMVPSTQPHAFLAAPSTSSRSLTMEVPRGSNIGAFLPEALFQSPSFNTDHHWANVPQIYTCSSMSSLGRGGR